MSHESSILPNITSVLNSADALKKEEFFSSEQDPLLFEHVEIKEVSMTCQRLYCN